MANAFKDFIKQNHGGAAGAGFAAITAYQNLSGTDSKLKGLLKTLRDLALIKFTWTTSLASSFGGLGKMVRGLIKDTGSLQAALDRLASVQKLTRTFAGLTGSLDQARQKVGALMKMSSGGGKVFSFEQWGRAAQGLQVFTRGAYAGSDALKAIGDAAAATGNSLVETSDAVSEVYDALRNGQPIDAAVEKLRQMGVISEQDAQSLDAMAQSGASVDQVFSKVTSTLDKHNGGMEKLASSVEAITARYEKAKQTLAEGVGEAWTSEDVENTQNAAEALEKITPALVRVSSFYAKLSGGLSTTQSWLTKQAVSIPGVTAAMEALAKGIGIVVAAITIFSVAALPAAIKALNLLIAEGGVQATAKLMQMGVGFTAASKGVGVFTTALRGLTTGAGVLVGVTAIAALAGAVIKFTEANAEAAKKADDLTRSLEDGTNAMRARLQSVHTLTEKNEALAESMTKIKEAQDALQELEGTKMTIGELFLDKITGGGKAAAFNQQRAALKRTIDQRTQDYLATRGASNKNLSPGEAGMSNMAAGRETQRRMEDLAFQQSMATGSVVGNRGTLADRIATLQGRAQEAAIGREAAANKEKGMGGFAAPGTSTHAMEMAAKSSGQDRANWLDYAKQQTELENSLPEILAELKQLNSEYAQTTKRGNAASLDVQSKRAMQEAQLSGDANKVNRLGNMEIFKQRYDELISQGLPQGMARGEAARSAMNSIKLNSNEAMLSDSQSAQVSSLQRIGGGGNIGPGAGDPLLDVNKQQKDLLEDIDEHIQKLLGAPSSGFKIK